MFKKLVLCFGVLLSVGGFARADVIQSFDDINVWVGTGSNRAAFVVDWNTGAGIESFAWGYRWDGTTTAEAMLRAIAASNTGLYGTVGYFGPDLGYALFGIGFDANRNGTFGVSPPLTFVDGIATESRDNEIVGDRGPTDPGDFYREGWWEGYWSYWVKSDVTGDWGYSGSGMSSRVLSDGAWDGWTFAPGFDARPPATPSNPPAAASGVPAPASGVMLVIGVCVLAVYRRPRAGAAIAA